MSLFSYPYYPVRFKVRIRIKKTLDIQVEIFTSNTLDDVSGDTGNLFYYMHLRGLCYRRHILPKSFAIGGRRKHQNHGSCHRLLFSTSYLSLLFSFSPSFQLKSLKIF